MKDAIRQALATVDFKGLLSHPEYEWAEEHCHFLVDVAGDEEYEQSEWFDPAVLDEELAIVKPEEVPDESTVDPT